MASEANRIIKHTFGNSIFSASKNKHIPIFSENFPRDEAQNSSVQKSVESIPRRALTAYKDHPDRVQFFQRAFNVATKIGSLAEHADANPYLNLAPVPLMTFHDCSRLKRRFGMMCTAAKTGQIGEAIFNGLKSADALGEALGNTSKTGIAICQIAGYGSLAVLGVIFTVIMPKFFMATSIVGLTTDFWGLIRVVNSYRDFCHRKGNENLESLLAALEYLRDGTTDPKRVSGSAQQHLETLRMDTHVEHHFRSRATYNLMKGRVSGLLNHFDPVVNQAKKLLMSMTHQKIFRDSADAIAKAFDPNISPIQALHEIRRCQEEIQSLIVNGNVQISSERRKDFLSNREELRKLLNNSSLKQTAQMIAHDAESEMRRMLFNNVLLLVLDILFMAVSCILLNAKSDDKKADQNINILVMTGCLFHMCYILFDNTVSKERWQQLENMVARGKQPIISRNL